MNQHRLASGALSQLRMAVGVAALGWALTSGMALAAPYPIELGAALAPDHAEANLLTLAQVASEPVAPSPRVQVAGGFGIGLRFGGISLRLPGYGLPAYAPAPVYEQEYVVEAPARPAKIHKPRRRTVAARPKRSVRAKAAVTPAPRVTRELAVSQPAVAEVPFLGLAPAGGPPALGDSTGGGRPTFRMGRGADGSGALGDSTGGGRATLFRAAPRRRQP
jgi:hypothetical protein